VKQSRFHHLLDAYGADLASWPDDERDPALRYLQANPSARADLAQAARLDAVLRTSATSLDDEQLDALVAEVAERIVHVPLVRRHRPLARAFRWFGAPMLIPTLAMGCFALGIVIGLRLGPASYIVVHEQFAGHGLLADLTP
jgi:hypothetical protein